MAKKLEVYKCDICGNIVEVLHAGQGTLVCCGQDMTLQVENTVDAAKEKHVPVIEKIDGGYKVSVIEWIELIAGDTAYRQFLSPGGTPEAVFMIEATDVSAREFCNLHGLWKS